MQSRLRTVALATAVTLVVLMMYRPPAAREQTRPITMQVSGDSREAELPFPDAKTGANYMHNFYFPPGLTSTPWWPAWSPDGKWIAVSMEGSIWKVDPATGTAFELTYNRRYHSSPSWSPDGRWIVYTAEENLQTIQLEILDVTTGESHRLTDDAHIYTDPVFSPDGTRVAYVSTEQDGHFNVYVRPIKSGRWAGPAVPLTTDSSFGRDRLYFGAADLHISPAWFPDGQELLIVSNKGVALGSGNIYRMPAEVRGFERARVVRAEQTLYRSRPDVSIDGKRLVYASTAGAADQYNNLYVQPTEGGEPYKLTFFDFDAFHPRWSPDGEWIAYITNKGGLPQLALLETYGGEQRTVRITDRRWKRPMGVLSVRILDEATGAPTAARIHLMASDGKAYVPSDAYARVSAARDRIFHSPGAFRVELPPGRVVLDVVKGFERWPERVEPDVKGGETTSVTIRLKTLTELADLGWYGGSTHVHMNYAGNLHNTLENLMMMSDAEDQDIVNEQIANKDNRILDYQYFVPGGGPHPLSRPDRVLVVGQEYRPPFYGHVFMFGMRDHLISPFVTGYEGTAVESLYPSNTDMFRKAKAQGATVGYVHGHFGDADPLTSDLGGAKGFMVDAALGTTDAVEWSDAGLGLFAPWYAALNNGFHVTATGGEDSISSMHQSKLVGSVRTYVYTGARGLSMHAWFQGLRDGRAFVTTGPLVMLKVNGMLPGDEVKLPPDGGAVDVSGWVRSIVPVDRVSLVFNGEAVESIPVTGDRKSVDFTRTLKVSTSGWYHLRVEGAAADRYPLDTRFPQAFTNPVWVTVGSRPVRSKAAADYSIKWIDKLEAMARQWPGWRSDKEKAHVFGQFEEARKIFRQRATEVEVRAR
jgi:TolB protein